MFKKLLALSLALVLCVCPVFAVSDADNSYYAFEPVSYGSLGLRSFSPLAASSGWTSTDHDWLNQIRLALTSKNTGTLLSYVIATKDLMSSSFDQLFDIKQNTGYLPNISNNTNSAKSLLDKIEQNTRSFTREQADSVTYNMNQAKSLLEQIAQNAPISAWTAAQAESVTYNVNLLSGYVAKLQEVLASDDDKALADAQKSNRDQIKQDFVSGSSGETSLGASDFGDLSSVGGSVKDSLSLNGQSSISGFTGGLSDSDQAGQGWFSAETRDALDSVSSSSSYGLKRDKSNRDIYNMSGFSDHYSWLYGD